jgi:hypothetical protein
MHTDKTRRIEELSGVAERMVGPLSVRPVRLQSAGMIKTALAMALVLASGLGCGHVPAAPAPTVSAADGRRAEAIDQRHAEQIEQIRRATELFYSNMQRLPNGEQELSLFAADRNVPLDLDQGTRIEFEERESFRLANVTFEDPHIFGYLWIPARIRWCPLIYSRS